MTGALPSPDSVSPSENGRGVVPAALAEMVGAGVFVAVKGCENNNFFFNWLDQGYPTDTNIEQGPRVGGDKTTPLQTAMTDAPHSNTWCNAPSSRHLLLTA